MALRLRQAVLVASELDPVAGRLREELGLGEPFADPGVGEFGLHNAVFALGDQFLEVIAPTQDGTAAGRYLERNGDGGYMLIFQLDDLEAARERARAAGIRIVWQIDLPDISGTHLHPADMRGAIVSLDRADPPGSWRWGGPAWTGRVGEGAPGRITGVVVEVPDPDAVRARWGVVLGGEPAEAGVRFAPGDGGLVEIAVAVPEAVRQGRDAIDVGGVRVTLEGEETT